MPQFIITPWRDVCELIQVRDQLYGIGNGHHVSTQVESLRMPKDDLQRRRNAVDTIRAWKIRGNLPHPVEATALLIDAALNDAVAAADMGASSLSPWGVRAIYANAFARFVTGLTDARQVSAYKQSMQKLAESIGLPISFVDIRHQATHHDLPSLVVLRQATNRALAWLWDHFWIKTNVNSTHEVMQKRSELEAGLKEVFKGMLSSYVKFMVKTARSKTEKKRGTTADAHFENKTIKETCGKIVNICKNDPKILCILASVLAERKLLVPTSRRLGENLEPVFQLWDPMLRSLASRQARFSNILCSELLNILSDDPSTMSTASSNPRLEEASIVQDPYVEAIYSWLVRLLTSSCWRGRPTRERHQKKQRTLQGAKIRSVDVDTDGQTMNRSTRSLQDPSTEPDASFEATHIDWDDIIASCLEHRTFWNIELAKHILLLETSAPKHEHKTRSKAHGNDGECDIPGRHRLREDWADLVQRASDELSQLQGNGSQAASHSSTSQHLNQRTQSSLVDDEMDMIDRHHVLGGDDEADASKPSLGGEAGLSEQEGEGEGEESIPPNQRAQNREAPEADNCSSSSEDEDGDDNDDQAPAWRRWKGPWVAKPIGVV